MANRDPQWSPWPGPLEVQVGIPASFSYADRVSDPDGHLMSFAAHVVNPDGSLNAADALPTGWSHDKVAMTVDWSGVGDAGAFDIVIVADDYTYEEALADIAALRQALADANATIAAREVEVTTLRMQSAALETENGALRDKLASIAQIATS